MTPFRLFLSSVQREFANERRAIKAFVQRDPLLDRFFSVFLFEDLPARDRKPEVAYLDEVDRCDVYVGLFGRDYGFEDPEGISPTEREFDRATQRGKPRFVFITGSDDGRHPKMRTLIGRAGGQLIRKRFNGAEELTRVLNASLVDFLEERGAIQGRPFEERPATGASLADIDEQAVARFVGIARHERQFALAEGTPPRDVLAHLNLLQEDAPTQAGVLLFGKNPQRFVPAAEVRCMHFHGTEIQRPAPSYQIFKGTVFEQVDRAADFVLSILSRGIGTRARGAQAPVEYEIPPDVVREAIVNAVAHRDYTSGAAVQVSVFADRFEVSNPGTLPPPLTPESLTRPHNSIPRNPRICEALFLARYIEKYGTGTLMMIRETRESELPTPDFVQREGEFVTTVWRDWLTSKRMASLPLNGRQQRLLEHMLQAGLVTISNPGYRRIVHVSKPTATRDLDALRHLGLLERVGSTGKGTHYVLKKGLTMGSMGSATASLPKASQAAQGDTKETKGTSPSNSRSRPARKAAKKGPSPSHAPASRGSKTAKGSQRAQRAQRKKRRRS